MDLGKTQKRHIWISKNGYGVLDDQIHIQIQLAQKMSVALLSSLLFSSPIHFPLPNSNLSGLPTPPHRQSPRSIPPPPPSQSPDKTGVIVIGAAIHLQAVNRDFLGIVKSDTHF